MHQARSLSGACANLSSNIFTGLDLAWPILRWHNWCLKLLSASLRQIDVTPIILNWCDYHDLCHFKSWWASIHYVQHVNHFYKCTWCHTVWLYASNIHLWQWHKSNTEFKSWIIYIYMCEDHIMTSCADQTFVPCRLLIVCCIVFGHRLTVTCVAA